MQFEGVNLGVVLITGSGSGMGQACALAFAKAGCYQFALLDLNEAGLRTTEEQLKAINDKVEVLTLPVNITEESEVVKVVQAAGQHFGRLDYVVQCAGLNQRPRALLHETEMVNYDKVMDINLRGLYMVQREVVRIMLKQSTPAHGQKGSIVNISSNSAVQPMPRLVPYAASKAGVVALTQGDAQAYASEGIRINCVCPGVILTPMNQSSIAAGEEFSRFIDATPSKRFGQPQEIAWTCLFLSHPNSGFIVGQSIVVDGGYTLT